MSDEIHEELKELYDRYFNIVIASTPTLLDAAYRLRYQVYCLENPFENAADHPDGREVDEFDSRSVHSLLIHRQSGAACGTVRLVLPDESAREAELPLCQASRAAGRAVAHLPRDGTAEISRFAVSKEFRRRVGEQRYADAGDADAEPSTANERRVIPYITFGLMRAVLTMSVQHRITHLCAVMEPTLIRLLSRFGLRFEPAGPPVEYHGTRQPCFARLVDLLAGVEGAHRDLWTVGTDAGRLLATPAGQGTRNRTGEHAGKSTALAYGREAKRSTILNDGPV